MKTFETKEECLKENGEHAWYRLPPSNISCLVMHGEGGCPDAGPKEKCYHCPAYRSYTLTQAPRHEWIESK